MGNLAINYLFYRWIHNIQEEKEAGSCSPLEELIDEVIKKKWCKAVFLEEMLNLHNETHLTRMMNWRLMHEEWTKGRSWSKEMSSNRLENVTKI